MTDQVQLSALQLNELELIRAGGYGTQHRYALPGEGAHHATLLLPDTPADGSIDLLDTEATPIARVEVSEHLETPEGTWIAGPVTTVRSPASPLFPELRPGRAIAGLSERGTLVLDGDIPSDAEGVTIVVDDGDSHSLSQAVARARRSGAEVRVLPVPAAHHVAEHARADLLAHLSRVLFASTVTLVHQSRVPRGHGIVILFTGLSGSGKSTIARELTRRLRAEDTRRVTLLDGDEVRTMLSRGLGFSREDRELNVRRIGWVASQIGAHDGIAICAPIAPYASMRAEVRDMATRVGRFVLVHVATPLEICEARDRKGLYAKARAGEIMGFTGISDPYEVPTDADVVVGTAGEPVDEACARILDVVLGTSTSVYVI